MQAITLTNEKSAVVDDEDFAVLNRHKWYLRPSKPNKSGKITYYAQRGFDVFNPYMHVQIDMHRQIMNTPKGKHIHHINGCGLDNRKQNLIVCTPKEHSAFHRNRIRS